MAERTIYDVSPNADRWAVRQRNGSHSSMHDRKEDAVDAGRRVAQANEPSQVVVRRQDGTIETEFTYGNDPYPPEG